MVPVTVRYTPTAAELVVVRSALRKGRPRPSIALMLTLSVLFLVQGVLNVADPPRGHEHWLGYVQIVFGVGYAPLMWAGWRVRVSFLKAERAIELRIDDAGITIAEPATVLPWKRIKTIVDVGDAFVFEGAWARRIAIFKRALPDGGRALWTALDEKLTSTRYLVRGTDSLRRINNGLAKR